METDFSKNGIFSAFWLKIIAAAAMLCDHAAVVFVGGNYAMRAAGRLAFPIFAFFIAEGYLYTRNIKKYALRLLVFALIAQAPFALAFGSAFYEPNVIFTLLFGLAAIWAYERGEGIIKWLIPLAAAVLAELTHSDHGAFGVFMVLLFFSVKPVKAKLLAVGALIVLMAAFYAVQLGAVNRQSLLLLFYIMPLALIYFYNGKKGPGGRFSKWFFYVFYPLHLAALWAVSIIMSKG